MHFDIETGSAESQKDFGPRGLNEGVELGGQPQALSLGVERPVTVVME